MSFEWQEHRQRCSEFSARLIAAEFCVGQHFSRSASTSRLVIFYFSWSIQHRGCDGCCKTNYCCPQLILSSLTGIRVEDVQYPKLCYFKKKPKTTHHITVRVWGKKKIQDTCDAGKWMKVRLDSNSNIQQRNLRKSSRVSFPRCIQ